VNGTDIQIIINLKTLERTFGVFWMASRRPCGWKKNVFIKKLGMLPQPTFNERYERSFALRVGTSLSQYSIIQ